MPNRMSVSRCSDCCGGCTNCKIDYDGFARADSTTIGGSWNEISGDWEISSERLAVGNSDALIMDEYSTLPSHPRYVVSVKVQGGDAGDELRVWICSDDASYGHYVQLTIAASGNCGTLSLVTVSGGSHTTVASIIVPEVEPGVWHTLKVCLGPGEGLLAYPFSCVLTTSTGKVRYITHGLDQNPVGVYAGLGTGTVTTQALFDDFCWRRLYASASFTVNYETYDADPTCPSCDNPCTYYQDDFNRADSTNLGCEWNEVSGSWAISGNHLEASSAGLLVSQVTQPEDQPRMSFSGTITIPSAGDKVRIYVAYEDASNWVCMEIESTDSYCGTITLISCISGIETIVSSVAAVTSAAAGSTSSWFLCLGLRTLDDTATYLVGGIGDFAVTSWDTVGGSGSKVAISVESINGDPIQFDDLAVAYTYEEANHPTCAPCWGIMSCVWESTGTQGTNCDWEIISGTWNPWAETSDSNAQAMTLTECPSGFPMIALGGMSFQSAGSTGKVFLAGGAIVGAVTYGADGCVELSISDGTNTETIVANTPTAGDATIVVTYTGSSASIGIFYLTPGFGGPSDQVYREISIGTSVVPTEATAGIGTGTVTGSVIFNFSFSQTNQDYNNCHESGSCYAAVVSGNNPTLCLIERTSPGVSITGMPFDLPSTGDFALIRGGGIQYGWAAAVFQFTAYNSTLKVVIAADEYSNGPYASLTLQGSTQPAIFALSSGQSTEVSNPGLNVDNEIFVCFSGGRLWATLGPALGMTPVGLESLVGSGSSSGDYGGVVASGAAGIEVSELALSPLTNRLTGEVCTRCPLLCQACENEEMATSYLVELVGLGGVGCCSNYNGAYVALTEGKCLASYDYPGYPGGNPSPCTIPNWVRISFTDSTIIGVGPAVEISVTLYVQPNYPSPGHFYTFSVKVAKPFNCRTFTTLTLPFSSASGTNPNCDTTSAVVYVSTL